MLPCKAGQPALAAQLLDHGRGVLLGQALDERTDLTALASSRPDLAARFNQLRDQLDPRLPGADPALAAGPDGQQAANAAASAGRPSSAATPPGHSTPCCRKCAAWPASAASCCRPRPRTC